MRTWLAIVAALTGCASGVATAPEGPAEYLALGDSVAFGYDPRVDHAHEAQYSKGYAELLAANQSLEETNASCPGEASGGFMSPDGNDNGCRENRQAYTLHVSYEGTQLAYAVDYLQTHPNTQLVTLDLGGNDVGKLNNMCAGSTTCIFSGIVGTLTDYDKNMGYIFSELRKVYKGPLVGLAIYNPYPTDTTAEWGLGKLNGLLAAQVASHDGIFVDGLAAFHAASPDPCKDGLLIAMPDGTCDIHPSPAGHKVLADAIEAAIGPR